MIQRPIDVLQIHPVRKTTAQKTAFIQDVRDYVQGQGYDVTVDTPKRGVRNIVIGDLQKARYLITAHYDTPASIGLPNLIVPNHPVWFFLVQMLLVSVLLGVSFGLAFIAYGITKNERAAFLTWYVVYFAILIMMRSGPANPSNANDNTSGVVTLLETLTAMPQEQREQVCFVLFDMEEAGLVGSKAFRKAHKDLTEEMIVFNLDCVGDGDVIQFTPVKKARENEALLSRLSEICGSKGSKEIRLRAKGFYGGSSDHKSFPNGVAIMSFRYRKGIGLYCSRIHTWRDKNLDYSNVTLLRDTLISLAAQPESSEIITQ